jgi:dCTP diphosphatase
VAFVDACDGQPFHGPKNLNMAIAIEAAELMERFQWLTTEEAQAAVEGSDERAAVADELADILIYCLSLSNTLNLDLGSAVFAKLQTNQDRYLADQFPGRFRRPERKKRTED